MSIFNCASLSEAAENEYGLQVDSDTEGIATAIEREFNQIAELEKNVFEYSAPMIPLVQKSTSEGDKYIVEFDMLDKLAKDAYKSNVYTAFKEVCKVNNLNENDVYVYLRGNVTRYFTESITEENAKKARRALAAINALNENDVNMVREIVDDDVDNVDEKPSVEGDGITTDPKADTIDTVQDFEDPKVVNDVNDAIAKSVEGAE